MDTPPDGLTLQWSRADRSVFKELVLAGDLRGAATFLERQALALLADRGAGSVHHAVDELPPHARSLLLRLAAADADVRLRTGQVDVMPAPADRLHLWTNAVTIAFVDWQNQQVPRALLRAVEQDAEGGRPAALELTPLVDLLSPPPASYRRLHASLRAALDQVGDHAGGPDGELAALWSGYVAFLWSACTAADFDATVPVAEASIERLAELRSPYEGWLRAALSYVCVLSGELEAAQRHITAVDRLAGPEATDAPPVVLLLARYARALITLWTQPGPAAIDALDRVASSYRRYWPQMASAAQAEAAAVLLDGNQPEAAAGYVERVRVQDPLVGQLLADRAAFLIDGDPRQVARLKVLLDVLRGSSWGRRAGIARLRFARDLRLCGFEAEAAAAREEALYELGPPERLSRWEALLLDAVDTTEPREYNRGGPVTPIVAVPAARSPGPVPAPAPDDNRVEVLRPALWVRRRGRVVDVPPLPARLLVVLVAERGPVTVDRLVDLLWPGGTLAEGRLKVANAVYRLRRALDLARDELVVRRGDVAELRPGSGWSVDAWEFWAASTGDGDDRRRALALYTADLCEQQLAYDDAVAEGRDRLTARWVDLAAGLLAEDPRATDPVVVAERAERIGVSSPGLVTLLARALAASGRVAEARMLGPSVPSSPASGSTGAAGANGR